MLSLHLSIKHYVVWGRLGQLRRIKGAILEFSILNLLSELIFQIGAFSDLFIDFILYLPHHWWRWRFLIVLTLLSSLIWFFQCFFRQTWSDPRWRHFVKRFSILILIIIRFNSAAFKCKKSKCLLEIELRKQSGSPYYTQILIKPPNYSKPIHDRLVLGSKNRDKVCHCYFDDHSDNCSNLEWSSSSSLSHHQHFSATHFRNWPIMPWTGCRWQLLDDVHQSHSFPPPHTS